MSVLIVTGTSTDVGKTVVTAAIAAIAPGSVAVIKPAQTGVGPDEPGDLAEVARLSRLSGATALHEFARYPDPLSPEAAARRAGVPGLDLGDVTDRIDKIGAEYDLTLVEGAGGLLVSFSRDGWTLVDLAHELRAPVLLVTAAGLGTLNHTALTLRVLADESLDVAGVVIGSWPASPGLAERSNVHDLRRMAGWQFAGALPENMAATTDFADCARASLTPPFGGTFDVSAFAAAARQE